MATNKKPRKPYHKKPERCFCATKEDLDGIKNLLVTTGLAAEIAVPAGTATLDDLACMHSLFNHSLVGLISRDYLDEDEREAAAKIIDAGGKALDAVAKKARLRAEKGEALRFIFTGDELNKTRDAVTAAHMFVNDSLDVEPHRTLLEFFAMKLLMRRGQTKDVSEAAVKRALDQLARMPTYKWRQI